MARPRWQPASLGSRNQAQLQVEQLESRHLLTLAPVNPLLFGLNQPWVDGSTYLDPNSSQGAATRDAVARLGVQALRYPGGTVSTYWDWQTGDYVNDSEMHAFPAVNQDSRKQAFESKGMAGPDGYYTPLAFDQFSQETGFQTVWVPNLATGDDGSTPAIVAHAADMFNYLSDNGVAVNYVEMGNEYDLGSFTSRFSNSQGYIRNHVNTVADRVRQLYPDAAIAVAGLQSGPIWGPPAQYAQALSQLDARSQTWDSGLAANRYYGGISNFDAVVYHNYRMNASALPTDPGTDNNNWEEALLAFPEASLTNAAQNARGTFGNDIRLWLTEFGINHANLSGTDPRTLWLQNTVTTNSAWDALFTAGFYLTGIQQSDTFQVMMRHDLAQVVRIAGPAGQNYAEIDPTGQVLAHLFNLAAQSEQMGPLTLRHNPRLPVTVMGDQLRALQGVEFKSDGSETFVILNRDSKNQNVTLPNTAGYTHLERWVYRADATVVPGGFAPIPDGPAPWLQGTPMSVVHGQSALDPNGSISFPIHGYSLEFVTVSDPAGPAAANVALALAGKPQQTEDRGQRTEDRRQKTEDRGRQERFAGVSTTAAASGPSDTGGMSAASGQEVKSVLGDGSEESGLDRLPGDVFKEYKACLAVDERM